MHACNKASLVLFEQHRMLDMSRCEQKGATTWLKISPKTHVMSILAVLLWRLTLSHSIEFARFWLDLIIIIGLWMIPILEKIYHREKKICAHLFFFQTKINRPTVMPYSDIPCNCYSTPLDTCVTLVTLAAMGTYEPRSREAAERGTKPRSKK